MIKVTKLNKEIFYINPTLIETVERTPDTVITLINGKKIIVSESIDEMRDIFIEYFKIVGMTVPQVIFNSFNFDEESQDIVSNKSGIQNMNKTSTK